MRFWLQIKIKTLFLKTNKAFVDLHTTKPWLISMSITLDIRVVRVLNYKDYYM